MYGNQWSPQVLLSNPLMLHISKVTSYISELGGFCNKPQRCQIIDTFAVMSRYVVTTQHPVQVCASEHFCHHCVLSFVFPSCPPFRFQDWTSNRLLNIGNDHENNMSALSRLYYSTRLIATILIQSYFSHSFKSFCESILIDNVYDQQKTMNSIISE